MPEEILESCTVSYYSRIYSAKGADRMATLVQSDHISKGTWFVYTMFVHILLSKNLGFSKLLYIISAFLFESKLYWRKKIIEIMN